MMQASSGQYVLSLEEAKTELGGSHVAAYIIQYAAGMECRQVVRESDYTDKDYLIDYANYYSRSHEKYAKIVERYHFFEKAFSEEEFHRAIENGTMAQLGGKYFGFCIKKPMLDRHKQPVIGRTMMSPPSDVLAGDKRRISLGYTHDVHLYGNVFSVRGLPFQSQDREISACATVALWTANQALHSSHGACLATLSEIAAKTTITPATSRTFPTSGLTLTQMIHYLRSIGSEVDIIHIQETGDIESIKKNVRDAKTVIKAYIGASIPIIATLTMKKYHSCQNRCEKERAFHAVVITGYGEDQSGNLTELYIHDDGIGPYCVAEWKEETAGIRYDWNNGSMSGQGVEWDEVTIDHIIAPVYPKFRLPSSNILHDFRDWQDRFASDGFEFQLLFMQSSAYKAELIKNSCKNRRMVLTKNLPRFLVIARMWENGKIVQDLVHDATSTILGTPIEFVKYEW